MPTAPARSAVVGAVPAGRESPFHAQTGPPVGMRARPNNDLLALSLRPAGVIAVTAVNALLSRISTATRLDAGDYLRGLCDGLAATFAGSGGPRLSCEAATVTLPIGAVITLGLIADLLITSAFAHAFPRGRVGRIALSFSAGQEALLLTVDDDGVAIAEGSRRDEGLAIARLLVLHLDGRLEIARGGETRCTVTVPRPLAPA
jgi:two-component sensor histidine kinase